MQTNSATKSQSAQSNYQPSVPISLYKELASELQAAQNKVTSLQLQNEQLLKQNQILIQEFTKEFEAIANSSQQLLKFLKTLNPEIQGQSLNLQDNKPQEPKLQDFVPLPPPVSPQLMETATKPKAVNYLQTVSLPEQDEQPKSSTNGLKSENLESRSPEAVTKPKPNHAPSPQLPQRQVAVKPATQATAAKQSVSTPPPTPTSPSVPANAPKPKTHEGGAFALPDVESTSEEPSMSGWWLALTILLIVITSFGAGYFLMRPFINSK